MQIQLPKNQKSIDSQPEYINITQTTQRIDDNNSIQQIQTQEEQDSKENHSQKIYRPDIDGLRAVAIALVVIFHAWPDLLTGGYIGVDMFFVISGYLITGIIIKQIQKGQFSYLKFYHRRIKRIFPALITVLITVLFIGYKYLPQLNLKIMCRTMTASTFFSANLQVLTYQKGYFDPQIQTNPLLHLWSLGVEQQFYIFWPFFLYILGNISSSKKLIALFAFTIASFILNLEFIQNNSKIAFYFPFCRFWEMSIGGLLCIYKKQLKNILIKSIMSFLSLILIIVTSFYITGQTQFPGYWALVPTLLTAFIISQGEESLINKYFLSNKLIVFIGKISYPWYLWHWPLLVFSRLLFPQGSQSIFSNIGFVVLISLGLSILTYFLVQNNIRYRKSLKTGTLLIIIMLLIGLISFKLYLKQQNEDLEGQQNNDINQNLIQQKRRQQKIKNKIKQRSKISHNQRNKYSKTNDKRFKKQNSTTITKKLTKNFFQQMMPQQQQDFYLHPVSKKLLPNSSKNKNRSVITKQKIKKSIYQNRKKPFGQIILQKNIDTNSPYYQNVPFDITNDYSYFQIANQGSNNTLFVIGDSHARYILFRFKQLWIQAKNKNMLQSFPTIVGIVNNGKAFRPCSAHYNFSINFIKKHRPKRVFFCNFQFNHFNYKDINGPIHENRYECDKNIKFQRSKADYIDDLRIISQVYKQFIDLGIQVYTVGIHPLNYQAAPSKIIDINGLIESKLKPMKVSQFRQKYKQPIGLYENAMNKTGVKIINFSEHQCWNDTCQLFTPKGYTIFRDSHHYSDFYSQYWASSVDFLTQF